MSSLKLGIDLGCTTCSVSVFRSGGVDSVANEQGSRTTPAVIAFTEVETLLGEPARGQLARNAANTVVEGLRLLGRGFDDPLFQEELARWKFRVTRAKDGMPQVEVTTKGESKSLPVPRLLSLLLARLRADADGFTGETVKEAVLSVPAHFDERQRAALKEAAQIGGIKVKLLLPSPLCVAVLYAHTAGLKSGPPTGAPPDASSPPWPPEQLLIVDVGGTTTTVSLVERAHVLGSAAKVHVDGRDNDGASERVVGGLEMSDELSVRVCRHEDGLGAQLVDGKLREHVVKEIRRRQRVDLRDNSRAMARLLGACEVAKHSLTTAAQATVAVEADGADYFANVSRAAIDDLTSSLAAGVSRLAGDVLGEAGVPPERVAAVLLAGGGARMPRVQAAISSLCPHSPLLFATTSEESVSRGAAFAGALLRPLMLAEASGERVAKVETRARLPRALAIATEGGGSLTLAERHASVPLRRTHSFAPPPPRPGDAGSREPLLLQLVELPLPRTNGSEAVSEAVDEAGSTAAPRPVASLAVKDVPDGAEALLVRLCVHADRTVELACEATFPAPPLESAATDEERATDGDDAVRGEPKRAEEPAASSAPRPPPVLLASLVV